MTTFDANYVSCLDEEGVITVGFADDKFNPTEYLLFQRTRDLDQQTQKSGHNSIYLELNSQNRSGYGGVELIRFDGTTLHVHLNDAIAEKLGTSAIEVRLSESDAKIAEIKEYFEKLVGNEPILEL